MAVLENDRLPDFIERGARGGLKFNTTVKIRFSGHETRFQNWADTRGEWDIGYGAHFLDGVAPESFLQPIVGLFAAARGMANSFRFKWWPDYQIPPNFTGDEMQQIALGDGSTTTFQAIRTYATLSGQYDKVVEKTVVNTDRLWIEGAEKTRVAGSPGAGQYSIDTATGKITTGDIPAAIGGSGPLGEQIVYLQCEFDFHVRFDTDHLELVAEAADTDSRAVSVPRIPIVEIKPQA